MIFLCEYRIRCPWLFHKHHHSKWYQMSMKLQHLIDTIVLELPTRATTSFASQLRRQVGDHLCKQHLKVSRSSYRGQAWSSIPWQRHACLRVPHSATRVIIWYIYKRGEGGISEVWETVEGNQPSFTLHQSQKGGSNQPRFRLHQSQPGQDPPGSWEAGVGNRPRFTIYCL